MRVRVGADGGMITEAQRESSERAGRAQLTRALDWRADGERAAFWKAVGIHYAPQSTQPEALDIVEDRDASV